jgi:hypothetical protein
MQEKENFIQKWINKYYWYSVKREFELLCYPYKQRVIEDYKINLKTKQ